MPRVCAILFLVVVLTTDHVKYFLLEVLVTVEWVTVADFLNIA